MIWTALVWLAALIALVMAWRVPRAPFFVFLAAAGFTLPKFLHYFGLLPLHLFMVNILIDTLVFLAIERWRTEEWGAKLCQIYKVSIYVSLAGLTLYCLMRYAEGSGAFLLAEAPPPSMLMGYLLEFYVISMEGLTYCALALIGRIGWPEVVNGWRAFHSCRPADCQTARSTLRAPRSSPSWQRCP